MSFDPSALPSLTSKVYLVTGGNAGIGYHTARQLALHGARVYIGSRSLSKASDAIAKIKAEAPNADVHFLHMDLMDLSSVVKAADEFKQKEDRLNGLVNNAGIMATPFAKSEKDGFEAQWETNYLSHWVLTWHLLDTLAKTAKEEGSPAGNARVVNLTSNGHKAAPKRGIDFDDLDQKNGGIWSRYGMSKLANILHVKKLNKLYGPQGSEGEKTGIWTAAVHPGFVDTDLNKQTDGPSFIQPALKCLGVYKKPEEGAYTTLFAVAASEFKQSNSGEYFEPVAKKGKPSKHASNMELADQLWEWTVVEMRKRKLLEQ
ncbi:uncharacterized protein TRUGW13939_10610 [Talaromyces rugulosus]|uniref:NAD(P)-binding protein n=1 Tax=Talaromyces rugulosus TaxID=121627 RepID=A0A7H8RAH1_TALRU|nr:uncharacterized protein TRUGW13939_10610 [Talaromyces rugulosus]QKX63440.1 hypothetical protein TRUGW13939_10610 [Talaromyces rugulosus]